MAAAESTVAALARGRALLVAADCVDASLDARLLLQAVLGFDHAGLILAGERMLSAEDMARYDALLLRRAADEPVSKILGVREFYGRPFRVTAYVLDPRADTETLVELALEQALPAGGHVLDLGSGSGALICTLLAEWPQATGVAVDLSPAALQVTEENARALGVDDRLTVLEGAWFAPVAGRFDLIVSNPPYIPSGDIAGLQPEVRAHDPHLALDGGPDGLTCYRAIAAGAAAHLAPAGRIIVEVGAGQAADVSSIFAGAGFHLSAERRDLGGHIRALQFGQLA
jgi:release factor glutamine methyltransferase